MKVFFALVLTMALSLAEVVTAPNAAIAQSVGTISFKPPTRGAPTRRIGGATRAFSDATKVAVVAPPSIAFAATPTPVLYWRTGGGAERAVLTLIAENAIDPVLEDEILLRTDGRVQAASLSSRGVRLEPGVAYEWSVAVIVNPDARSEDVVSSALIQHQPAPIDRSDLSALADEGYWYDLVEGLLGPDGDGVDAESARVFEDLAAQAGLPAAVE